MHDVYSGGPNNKDIRYMCNTYKPYIPLGFAEGTILFE